MKFNQVVSATKPDWSREKPRRFWDPGKKLIQSIRKYQKWKKKGFFGNIISKYFVIVNRFWSFVCSSEIPIDTKIEGGLMFPHPIGIVIGGGCEIGPNCLIFQEVTITNKVQIGGHVDIGTGAKILNKVKIGNHVQIGANAVVLKDIPSNSTAVGVPAKIIRKNNK